LPIACCFVAIGQDNVSVLVTFGRILNTGFLSIYLCFILVAYRLVTADAIKVKWAIVIDFLILICLFTHLANLLIISFLYIVKIYQYLRKEISIYDFIDLYFLSVGIVIYLILMINNGLTQSQGQSGLDGSYSFSAKPLLGRMIFNNFFGAIYSDLPSLILILLFFCYLFLTYKSRLKIHWFSLYVLSLLPIANEIWRPGLLGELDNYGRGIYAMPTLLISLFFTFSLLSYFLKNWSSRRVGYSIWSVVVIVILFNGIYVNRNQADEISKTPIEKSFRLAQPGREDGAVIEILGVNSENRIIYELPINPQGWSMLFLKEDLEKMNKLL